jgi:hypothetical protein
VARPDRHAVHNPGVYRLVANGRERVLPLPEPPRESPPARFRNSLKPESLSRIRAVVETARRLRNPATTEDVVVAAAASSDRKGALGALRMLDVEGIVHARSGGRRQLVWHPGPRPRNVPVARMVDRPRYELLRYILQTDLSWRPTDWLIREAEFDLDLQEVARRSWSKSDRDLPVTYFADYGKSARKYVLGALKALYWLEQVSWRNFSQQAIEWLWIASVPTDESLGRPSPRSKSISDGYLSEGISREERLRAIAFERELSYMVSRQHWVETHSLKGESASGERRNAVGSDGAAR